jgi:2-methylisocitrate lyase-like PEP mutase family enzyme
MKNYPKLLKERLKQPEILPLIGVYDVFSAGLVAERFEGLFCSGYGFSASYYGLPDVGHITWSDLVNYVLRIRSIAHDSHILVDVDDGFGDETIAIEVLRKLEMAGASAVMLEDQKRPKKCGHLDGKNVVPMDEHLAKLSKILLHKGDILVLARTDVTDLNKGIERIKRFIDIGADAVMVEGLKCREDIDKVSRAAGETPFAVNLIKGGKTPLVSLSQLKEHGAKIAIYSTPCLFAAQESIKRTINELVDKDGILSGVTHQSNLNENNEVLLNNAFKSIKLRS